MNSKPVSEVYPLSVESHAYKFISGTGRHPHRIPILWTSNQTRALQDGPAWFRSQHRMEMG
jgi:hypothetical protein